MDRVIGSTWRMLAYAYGAVLILIGIDKAVHSDFIANWAGYMSPLAQSVIPLDTPAFLVVLGIAEVLVGILFFTRYVRIAAAIAIAVLALIIVNLISLGLYDIAARDVLIALGSYAVIRLAAAQGYSWTTAGRI